jgi:hypothetical protein
MHISSQFSELGAGEPFYKRVLSRRALKHRKERMNKKDIKKMNVTALYPPGLKSHRTGLLLYEENGKCDAAKRCAEFPCIGNHSPEQQVNHKWPYRDVTLPGYAET